MTGRRKAKAVDIWSIPDENLKRTKASQNLKTKAAKSRSGLLKVC